MLSDLRFGLRLSAHSISERPSDASSVADRDGGQQPLLESVCDNGLVQDIHMANLIQYVESGHVQLLIRAAEYLIPAPRYKIDPHSRSG